jgi:UDP-3-O-[3-hydroxymyristoyl] glucosamine N-acyltransferase
MRSFSLTPAEIEAIVLPVQSAGERPAPITGLASLEKATQTDLSFLGNRHYEKMVADSGAGILLLPTDFAYTPKPHQKIFFVKDPSLAFALVCERIERLCAMKPAPGIHPSAVVDREAWVSPEASVGPLCVIEAGAIIRKGVILHAQDYIGPHVTVGADTELKPGVRILTDCEVGERCIFHSGVVVGSDGFGYALTNGGHHKIPQIGKVVVGDDVEIGANTTIDRARFGATTIGAGTKIDNLVQIGHNVTIGRNCLLVAQSGVAGSTTLEDYVVLGGQSGLAGHITIGAGSQVAGQAGVPSNLPPKSIVTGTPAFELQKAYRVEALKRKLPELFKRIEALEEHFKK